MHIDNLSQSIWNFRLMMLGEEMVSSPVHFSKVIQLWDRRR